MGSPAAKRWAYFLDRYHYLGFRVVGENLGYLARDRQQREVGCLLFGAAAWRRRRTGVSRSVHHRLEIYLGRIL